MEEYRLKEVLQRLGLREREAAVYLASLKLGPAAVAEIARSSRVKRTTAYSILDSLKTRGLMHLETRGMRDFWVAAEPKKLLALLDEQRSSFMDALPYLSSMHTRRGDDSIIRHYEGVERLKELYLEMLDSVRPNDDYMVLSNVETWREIAPDFFDNFTKRRGRMLLNVRMILNHGPFAALRKTNLREGNERVKLYQSANKLSTNLVIIPSKILVHQLVPPYVAMVIENNHIIKMHREMYEVMWANLAD